MLAIAIGLSEQHIVHYTTKITESVAGTVIYNDGTVGYEILPSAIYACTIGKDVVYVTDSSGKCNDVKSFVIKHGTANLVKTTGIEYFGKELTVIQNGYIETYPAGHRAGLPFAIAKGKHSVGTPIKVSGTIELVNNGMHFKLYKISPSSEAYVNEGFLCHSATGSCVKRVSTTNTQTSYYYLAGGDGEEWIELGTDFPDREDLYMPTASVSVERKIIGVTPETNINLALPYLPIKERDKRFVSLGVAIYSLATVRMHKKSIRAGFAVQDINAKNLAKSINTQASLFSESLVREGAIVTMDLKVLEETAVNNYKHRGLKTIASSLRRKQDGIEEYMLMMSQLYQTRSDSQTKIIVKYRDEIVNKTGGRVLSDVINGDIYTATVMVGEFTTGSFTPDCDEVICLVSGGWYHYERKDKLKLIDGPVLTTASCGLYLHESTTQYERGRLTSMANTKSAVALLKTTQNKYFYVNEVDCHDEAIDLSNPKITEMTSKIREVLGTEKIKMVRDGFKIECPEDDGENGNITKTIRSYLCESTHEASKINDTIALIELTKVIALSSLDAFDKEAKKGMASILSQMTDDTISGLVKFGQNFSKFQKLLDSGDLDAANLKVKVALAMSITAVIMQILTIVVFLCLYSRLRNRELQRSSQDSYTT